LPTPAGRDEMNFETALPVLVGESQVVRLSTQRALVTKIAPAGRCADGE